MGFINNQRFKITKLGVFIIDFEDGQDNKREINNNDFQKSFLVALNLHMHAIFIARRGWVLNHSWVGHTWSAFKIS